MSDINFKSLSAFGYELGQLRHLQRTGWHRIGLNVEKLSDHTARATQLAFIIAFNEQHPDPSQVATMVAFHEIGEARCHDLDYVARRYVDRDERLAVQEQTSELGALGTKIFEMWLEVEEGSTPAGKLAKDADYLDNAFTARELIAQGHKDAQLWLNSIEHRLTSATAKKLFAELCMMDPHKWWQSICHR